MKKTFFAIAAGSLMSIAGFASAAEPMQLTEGQMDGVAAGSHSLLYITSSAAGEATAKRGFVFSKSATNLTANGGTSVSSYSKNFASGYRVSAASGAGTTITYIRY